MHSLPCSVFKGKKCINTLIKYFSLDIAFKVLTKCTKHFVTCSGPLPQGKLFQAYQSKMVSCDEGGVKSQLAECWHKEGRGKIFCCRAF